MGARLRVPKEGPIAPVAPLGAVVIGPVLAISRCRLKVLPGIYNCQSDIVSCLVLYQLYRSGGKLIRSL